MSIIIFLGCILFLFLLGRFFIWPLKTILKLIGNSIIGGIIIFVINTIGGIFGFHIGLNLITSILVGVLGVPRCHFIGYHKIICWIKAKRKKNGFLTEKPFF